MLPPDNFLTGDADKFEYNELLVSQGLCQFRISIPEKKGKWNPLSYI